MRLLISTGEVSGDLQGSYLIHALKKQASIRSIPLEIIALGGPRMKAAGAELLADTAPIGAIGLWEALPLVLPTLKVQRKLEEFLRRSPPDAVVLIDYMGPNIRLGNKLRSSMPHIPITYYIAPQEWAWRLGDEGTTDLIDFTDKILAIFKLEAEFYSDRGGDVKWVGHPMVDNLNVLPTKSEAYKKLGLNEGQKLLLLLPASRTQEIRYLMPTLSKTASMIQRYDPSIQVLVPAGLSDFEISLQNILKKEGVKGKVLPANSIDQLKPFLFAAADLALGKSGTINMELALNDVPQVVGYKVSRITAFLAKRILRFRVDHISPVNLLLKERLVPELVQDEFNPEALYSLAISLLSDKNKRKEMLSGYSRLRSQLGTAGATDRAAKEILDLVD